MSTKSTHTHLTEQEGEFLTCANWGGNFSDDDGSGGGGGGSDDNGPDKRNRIECGERSAENGRIEGNRAADMWSRQSPTDD